jgi:transposase InsO family protein
MRQFHQYIWGYKLVIITDHKPLIYIKTSVQLAHALQQWLDVILDYHFTIKHRPGILHVLPDALSRMYEACYTSAWGVPVQDPYCAIEQQNLPIDKDILVSMSQAPPLMENKRRSIRTRTGTRSVSCAAASRRGHRTISAEMKEASTDSNAELEQDRDQMEHKYDEPQHEDLMQNESASIHSQQEEAKIISTMERRGKILPLSHTERMALIDEEHARGHFGREAIFRVLHRRGFWWVGIRRDIQERIRRCIPCLRYVIAKTGFDPATPITAALPFDHIQIDTILHLIASIPDGFTVILVIVDVCTGFIILRAIKDTRAETVAPVLWNIFNDFGFPRVIQSDNGPEFTSQVVHEITRLSGVDHRFITPYQPRTDGKVERNIGTVKLIIKKHLHGVFTNWPAFVPWAQSCVNNKITELTGSTPFSLMFGRRFNPYQDYSSTLPLEKMHETEWSRLQDQMISVIYPSIAERVALQKRIMTQRMNRRTRSVNFRKGDIVMLRRHERVMGQPIGTLENEYVGPYMIESKNRTGAITLIASNGTPLPRLVRPNQLKFVSHFASDFKQDVYEVETIIDHRGEGDNREYKVHWKGYSSDEDNGNLFPTYSMLNGLSINICKH